MQFLIYLHIFAIPRICIDHFIYIIAYISLSAYFYVFMYFNPIYSSVYIY